MNISLGPQWEAFIDDSIKSGRYHTVNEVLLDGLRLLREEDEHCPIDMEELRREVDKGIEAIEHGDFVEYDADGLKQHLEDVKSRGRERLAQRARSAT